jgi:hypothetical protein
VNIDVYSDQPERSEFPDDKTCVLRFDPGDFVESRWERDWPGQYPEKVCGLGSGKVVYELNVPDGVDVSSLQSIEVLFEGAARAGLEKVDARMVGLPWSRKKPTDYPQTDSTKWPTEVTVLLNGNAVEKVRFADDPADARGILSHACGKDPGSYGDLTAVRISGDKLTLVAQDLSEQRVLSIAFAVPADAAHKGGFALYGDRMGRYAVDPTVVLKTSKPIDLEAVRSSSRPIVAVSLVEAVRVAARGEEKWKYTLTDPGKGWQKPDFDDTQWKEGACGFGHDPGNLPSAQARGIRTEWTTSDIWLRKVFEAPEALSQASLAFSHDEDMDVYLNGTLVLSRSGYIADYEVHQLSGEQSKCLRTGKNVLAVHCHQTAGGQYIDVGFAYRAKTEP